MRKLLWALSLLALVCISGVSAAADDLPTFKLSINNGQFNPKKIQVPAGKKIKLEITNAGTEAVEFESKQLRKEKAISPGGSSFVVIFPLDPGEYAFFDDFHLQAGQGAIVAK